MVLSSFSVVQKCREHTINTVKGVRCDSFFWCAPVILVFIKISTTRPQPPSNVQWFRALSCGRSLKIQGFRPHFNHADCHLLSISNSKASHVYWCFNWIYWCLSMLFLTLIILLSNVVQHLFQTLDNTFFKRWKHLFQALDNIIYKY